MGARALGDTPAVDTTEPRGEPLLHLAGVTKHFGPHVAVDDVSLAIYPGELFALLGPSGCGKTTLLRLLAGFEYPSHGVIHMDGVDVSDVPPNRRPVNMVFQSYATFPHMSVADNVAYGLKVSGTPSAEIKQRVAEALALVQLQGLERRRPDQLSGGQRQRVALARALVKRPKVLLLDEPLSALDAKLREAMQLELVHLQRTVGTTFVVVTHDQNEALSMASRIAVMDKGRVLQVASPRTLYEAPNCRFVADFIGKINAFTGSVIEHAEGGLQVRVTGLSHRGHSGDLTLPATAGSPALEPRQTVEVAVRPENVRLERQCPDQGWVSAPGTVVDVAYYGSQSHVYLDSPAGLVVAHLGSEHRSAPPREGETLWLTWRPEDTLLLTA
ncbi:MAG: ABC transporter ATP-binding protein [Candidatus Competibacterales bacterium]